MKKTLTKYFLLLVLICGAALNSSVSFAKTYMKVFPTKYDRVWKSALIAMTKYPLEKNDKDSGELVTSTIAARQIFKPYNYRSRSKEEYSLNISLEKRKYQGRKVVLVKIDKRSVVKGDFINKDRELESDGLEEEVLLYRIAREIKIDRAVEKLYK